jgi:hypothetical protein
MNERTKIEERAAPLSDRMSYTDFFKARTELTKAFCDAAKAYIQISSAALALPLLFTQSLLGKDIAERGLGLSGLPLTLTVSWGSFLLSIGFGLCYQWLATRRLWDQLHSDHITAETAKQWGFRTTPTVPTFEGVNRSFIYGAMVLFFYVGAISFVLFAAKAIRG